MGQAPEIGVPVLMVEVDRSAMTPADVAAKFPRYRELFHTKARDNDPVLAGKKPATARCTGGVVPGLPHPARVPDGSAGRHRRRTDRLPTASRSSRTCRPTAGAAGGAGRSAATTKTAGARTTTPCPSSRPPWSCWPPTGRSGQCAGATAARAGTASSRRWRTRTTGRLRPAPGRPRGRGAQGPPQADGLPGLLDCGEVSEEESTWEYGRQGQVEWTRRPGGRC